MLWKKSFNSWKKGLLMQVVKITIQLGGKIVAFEKTLRDSLETKFNDQQRLVEKCLSSKINDALKVHASETQKHS